MRKIPVVLVLAAAAATAACGIGSNTRLLTRPESYEILLGFPSTGNPLDIRALEKNFPELKGIVMTAPEYIEEYERDRMKKEARGETLIPYRIPSGANINIEVVDEPGLSRPYYIGPHGYVDFPLLGEVQVVGLTVRELKLSIQERLKSYLRKPQVLIHVQGTPQGFGLQQGIALAGTSQNNIYVFGAVTGRFFQAVAYTGGETLISVLGLNGLPSNAEWRQVRIIRRSAKDPMRESRVIMCDLWEYFAHADVRQDVPLFPGDVIFVPVKRSLGEQFQKDWDLTLKYLGDVLFLDSFRDAARSGGALRD